MPVIIAMKSESKTKTSPELIAKAVRANPKIAARVRDITKKIKALHTKAIVAYRKRKAADAKKHAEHGAKHGTSTVVGLKHSDGSVTHINHKQAAHAAEQEVALCTEYLHDLLSTSANTAETSKEKAELKKKAAKTAKNPKLAARRKLISSAMRIRENKPVAATVKKLKAGRDMLRNKAVKEYVAKQGTKSKPEAPAKKKKPITSVKKDITAVKAVKKLVKSVTPKKAVVKPAKKVAKKDPHADTPTPKLLKQYHALEKEHEVLAEKIRVMRHDNKTKPVKDYKAQMKELNAQMTALVDKIESTGKALDARPDFKNHVKGS